MRLIGTTKRFFIVAGAVVFIGTGTSAGTVSAHVTVVPQEASTASRQIFTVRVPNEKPIPTTSVRLVIPDAVTNVTPTQNAGWSVRIERNDDTGDVREVTWYSGEIQDGLRDEFTFSARMPESAGELEWHAYQTYSDGSVVAWDRAEAEGDGHSSDDAGPFSVTKVVDESAETEDGTATQRAEIAADRALYVAIAALVVGLVAIFLSTRSSRQAR